MTTDAYADCTRARVAIDVPCSENEGQGAIESILHLGHAATILRASLIAEELGLPLDIRLDGHRLPGRSDDVGVLVSLCTIISHLGIQCRRVYWIAQQPAAPCEYEAAFGRKGAAIHQRVQEIIGNMESDYPTLIEDDLLFNYPSLVIRGTEFLETSLAPTQTSATYVSLQRSIYAVAGREWHEVNVPLITREHRKLSKSLGTSLTWELFSRWPGEWVRDWLIATALSPTDPLSAVGRPFTLKRMTTRAYEWNWEDWDTYVRGRE